MSEARPTLSMPLDLGSSASADVLCQFAADPGDEGMAAADGCLALLVAAAAVGAFAVYPHKNDPAALMSTTVERTTTRRLWCLRWRNCDFRFFELLRAMLGRLRRDKRMCRSLLVVGRDAGAPAPAAMVPWPADGVDALLYPPAQSEVSRLLKTDSASTSKSRRFLVTLTQSVEASQVNRARVGVQAWFDLLEAGAYAMPAGHPATTESIAGAVTQFDDRTVEVAVNRFMASEMAWLSLANVVVGCDAFGGSVASMEVD